MREGVWPVAGVDEAGRGPLAGPVAAAAVILDPKNIPRGLDDSKRLEPEEREALSHVIFAKALAVGIGFAPAQEIDRINIRQATHAAMRRALRGLSLVPLHILIDGNDIPQDLPCAARAIVKGDATSASIAAASIIAKVTRDRLMHKLDLVHPAYGFAHHAGYATERHRLALEGNGPCEFHRMTFASVKLS